ncbi:MAG: ATP-binding cassette domain-containing protein [Fervidicoccaceae archaeon]
MKNLVKIYSGGVRALDGLDLSVEEGSIHAILGPNGAGKTTLIRILTTQLLPTSGSAKVFGLDVVKRAADVRNFIGYVPQEVSLWTDLTGYENLLIYSKIYGIPSEQRKQAIDEVLNIMDLEEASHRLVKTYSGGMFRRLEIACALMVKPRLMILDEPTIGLDPNARRIVWEKILEYKKEFGTTIFFATHYMDEADKYANFVSLIVSGKIIQTGTPEELKASAGGDRISMRLDRQIDGTSDLLLKIDNIRVEKIQGDEIEIVARGAFSILPSIISFMQSRGIKIREIKVQEATLDEAFIALTGKRITEESGNIKELVSERKMIRRGG